MVEFRNLPIFRTGLTLGVLALTTFTGCQTPERKTAMDRMNALEAENSSLRAKSAANSAEAQMAAAQQTQQNLAMIEALSKKIDELNARIAQGATATPATNPATPSTAQAELEKTKAEMQAKMVKMQEDVAKAQATADAAKAAADAQKGGPKDPHKDGSLKGKKLPLAKFIDSNGKLVNLSDYTGQKPVVLVVMMGFYSQGICIYCTQQTADLARNIEQFKQQGAEVLIVYPGGEDHINAFVKTVKEQEKSTDPRFALPFKVLLDVNQDAVKAMNISGDLAHPTSFVLDKDGVVQYQYTGRTPFDRPKFTVLLEELKKLGSGK
jgi:peroxiredoxin